MPNVQIVRARTAKAALLAAGLAFVAAAHAHGPTRQKVTESAAIQAPCSKVWALIKDFDALSKWHPAVAASPADKGNAEGSVRTLQLKSGGQLTETIEAYDDAAMKMSYRAKDGGALPVSNYTATLKATADGDAACTVEWRGAFYRGYPNNDPPPDQNDDAAVAAVTAVYKAGLANLKALAEAK